MGLVKGGVSLISSTLNLSLHTYIVGKVISQVYLKPTITLLATLVNFLKGTLKYEEENFNKLDYNFI